MRAAERAGTRLAPRATATTAVSAAPQATGSAGAGLEELRGDERQQRHRGDQADAAAGAREAQRLRPHERADLPGAGAERVAQAQLARALRDDEGQQAVDARGAQHQGETREHGDERAREAVARRRAAHQVRHRRDRVRGLGRVDGVDLALDAPRELRGVTRSAHDHGQVQVRVLGVGDEDLGAG